MLEYVRDNLKNIERCLESDEYLACTDGLSGCNKYPEIMNTYCPDLQTEMVETLVDAVYFPDEREQTCAYLKQQQKRYEKNLEEIKKRYNMFMFHLDDHTQIMKAGREQAGYSPEIVRINLQFQDLKFELSSYLEGYHKDRYQLHSWLLTVLQG